MPLTDSTIRAAKADKKALKLFDAGSIPGSCPFRGQVWRLKYRFEGKEKRVSLGGYPTVGLKDDRKHREQAKTISSLLICTEKTRTLSTWRIL